MKKVFMVIMLIAIAGSSYITHAQQPAVVLGDKSGWHRIGQTNVDLQRDRDEILVIGANRFAAIKFKVTEAPIDLISLEVYYSKGYKQDINVNFPINTGKESPKIDLKGSERNLQKIIFVYKTRPNSKYKKAHVEVWGLKTNTDRK